jgi:hypothetical protein
MRSNSVAPTHTPSHAGHSRSVKSLIASAAMEFRHSGQRAIEGCAVARTARVPHCGQNVDPSNMRAKQCGQLIAASLARQ